MKEKTHTPASNSPAKILHKKIETLQKEIAMLKKSLATIQEQGKSLRQSKDGD